MDPRDSSPGPCPACGSRRPPGADRCAACGAGPEASGLADTPEAIASLLDAVEAWRAGGLVDAASAARLRRHYERRLQQLAGPSRPPGAPGEAAAGGPAPSRAAAPTARRPPAAAIGEWAARRQADVLLYVGAFLLVISALVFVSSRDEALRGGGRVALLAAYTGGFLLAGWLLGRWSRVREAGPAFLAIGALLTPLNFLLLHNEVLGERDVPGELVWFLASAYSTAFYGFLAWRGLGRLYILPAGAALLSAWGSLAVTARLPLEWGGPWWMAFALAGAVALAAARRRQLAGVAAVAATAALALLFAHLIAYYDGGASGSRWQLPATHALLLAAVAVLGASFRQPFALLPAWALGASAACSALWAAGVDAQWSSFPPLLAAAGLVAGRARWSAWHPGLAPASLLLAAAGGLTALAWLPAHLSGNSWTAAAAALAAAALFAQIARQDTHGGLFTRDPAGAAAPGRLRPTHPLERTAFAWAGFIPALAAVGFAQRGLGIAPPDAGWAFAAAGVLVSASLVLAARRSPARLWALLPLLLLATAVSVHAAGAAPGHHAALLALPAAHALAAFALLGRWSLAATAGALGLLALAALWEWQAWPWWRLGVAYAALAVPLAGALARRRRYDPPAPGESEAFTCAHALSWLPLAAALLTAAAALAARVGGTDVDPVTTVEYRALVLVAAVLAALIGFEAWRLGAWELGVAAAAAAAAVAAALWPVLGWPAWTLAAAYSAAGAACFGALSPWRLTGTESSSVAVHLLSWAGLALGPLVALQALGVRVEATGAEAAELVEFRALAILLLPASAAAAFDGRRLGVRWAMLPASALLVVALELAIATLQPGNVQAHTVPAALYLALVGLLARSSDPLHPQLGWHELLQLAGAALLVLPQAEQGFEPGGTRWGLVLLLEGLLVLGAAIVLNARWLAVSAVATLSGVALRFLWVARESGVVPYWVMLAAAGFFLLAVGLTVLVQREWWDRARIRIGRRWQGGALLDARAGSRAPAPALLSALAPVVVILLLTGADSAAA